LCTSSGISTDLGLDESPSTFVSAASTAIARRCLRRTDANTVAATSVHGTAGEIQNTELANRSRNSQTKIIPRLANTDRSRSRFFHDSEKEKIPKTMSANGKATTRSIK